MTRFLEWRYPRNGLPSECTWRMALKIKPRNSGIVFQNSYTSSLTLCLLSHYPFLSPLTSAPLGLFIITFSLALLPPLTPSTIIYLYSAFPATTTLRLPQVVHVVRRCISYICCRPVHIDTNVSTFPTVYALSLNESGFRLDGVSPHMSIIF